MIVKTSKMSSRINWRQSRSDVLTDFNLNPRAGGLGGGLEQRGNNIFINVFFATIGADSSRNTLEDQSGSVLVQSHRGRASLCCTPFANHAFHALFLLLLSGSHSSGSGSSPVVTIFASSSILSA